MRVCFWPDMNVVAVENPTYIKHLIFTSPVDSEENRWGSSNQAFFSAHVNLCCVGVSVGCVSRSVSARLNIWSQLVTNYSFFFRILKRFYFIASLSHTHFDGPLHGKHACPTHSCLTINLCFGPRITSRRSGMECFRTCIFYVPLLSSLFLTYFTYLWIWNRILSHIS